MEFLNWTGIVNGDSERRPPYIKCFISGIAQKDADIKSQSLIYRVIDKFTSWSCPGQLKTEELQLMAGITAQNILKCRQVDRNSSNNNSICDLYDLLLTPEDRPCQSV